MILVLRIVCTALLLWSWVGLAVWAWTPAGWRRLLLPAVPLIGVMALAVGLHLTGLVLGAGSGVWLVIIAALVALAIRSRDTRWWLDLSAWRWPATTTLAGLAVATVLLSPMATIGAQLIEPAGSNDGYAYTTTAEWLGTHSLLEPPAADAPPAWGYVRDVYAIGLRLGQDVDQAAVAQLSGVDAKDSWYIVMALSILLIPGGVMASARLLGLGSAVGFVAGLMASASAVVVGQVLFSNAASVVGIAATPFVLALVARFIGDVSRESPDAPPLWFVAGAAAALVCTYTEALPVVLPGALGLALHLGRAHALSVAKALARLGVGIVCLTPLGVFRAAKSVKAAVGGLDSAGGALSPFRDHPIRVIASHLAGTQAIFDDTGRRWSYIIVAALAIGLVLSVTMSSARRFFGWHLGSVILVIGFLSFSAHTGYGQGRAVTIAMSLLLLAVAAGWAALFDGAVPYALRPLPRLAVRTGAVLAVGGFVAVNVSTVLPYLVVGQRHYGNQLLYTAEFDAAGQWVERVAPPDGAQAMVVVTDIHEQFWLRYRLRDLAAVQFPYLIPLFSDRLPDVVPITAARYIIAQRQAWLDADPRIIVAEDADFRYLDTNAGSLVLAAGAAGFHAIGDDGRGGAVQWMQDDGELLVVHDPTVHRIRVTVILPPGQPSLSLTVSAGGLPDQHVIIQGSTTVTLLVPSAELDFLRFHNNRPAVKVAGLPWPASLAVTGVNRA